MICHFLATLQAQHVNSYRPGHSDMETDCTVARGAKYYQVWLYLATTLTEVQLKFTESCPVRELQVREQAVHQLFYICVFHSGPTGMSGLLRRKGVNHSPYTLPAVHTLPFPVPRWRNHGCIHVYTMLHPFDGIYVMSKTRPSLFLLHSSSSVHYCEHKWGRPGNNPSNRQWSY